MRRRRLLLACIVCVGVAAPGCVPAPPPGESWLEVVNAYRAVAGLAPVVEEPSWSAGAQRHAEYTARMGVVTHGEDPNSPYFSPEGHAAATQGNIGRADDVNTTDRQFVEDWLTAPFHAVGILDPRLAVAGYGVYRDPSTPIRAAAVLNVIAGMRGPAASDVVTFPGNGATVALRASSREYPNPLVSCPGYAFPAGLPITVQLPSPGTTIIAATLSMGFLPIEVCRYDGHTYANPDPVAQGVGRVALLTRNATVIIPRHPLQPGTYTASALTSDLRVITWTFMVR